MATGLADGAPRAKDGFRSVTGRYGLLSEVARSYLGALFIGRDTVDDTRTVFVRRVTPLIAATARASILDAARFAREVLGEEGVEVIENRAGVDFATPFFDAEPIRVLLRTAALRHVATPPRIVLGMVRDWLAVLAAHHEHETPSHHAFGGAHPDSVFVGPGGYLRLLDVGTGAAASAREPFRSDAARIGYFAPEQVEPKAPPDARTDVFAVGIVLWEALSNRRLFPGNDAQTVKDRVRKGAIARLDATRPSGVSGTPTDIADLVARALERAPPSRFQTAREMLAATVALDCAANSEIGEWVTSLADVALAKRRQILERAGSSPAPTPGAASLAPRKALVPSAEVVEPSDAANATADSPPPTSLEPTPRAPPPIDLFAAPSEPEPPRAPDSANSELEPSYDDEGVAGASPHESEGKDEPSAESSGASAAEPHSVPETAKSQAPLPPSRRAVSLRPPPKPSAMPKPSAGGPEPLPEVETNLAQPIHASALATLTAPPKKRDLPARGIAIAAALGIAATVALGAGYWLGRGRPPEGRVPTPSNITEVREPGFAKPLEGPRAVTAEAASARVAASPSSGDVAQPRPEASAGLAPSTTLAEAPARAEAPVAEAAPPPPSAAPKNDSPTSAAARVAPEPNHVEATSVNALSPTSAAPEPQHRPPPSHTTPNSNYEPGGI